jgi:hypothetical protein
MSGSGVNLLLDHPNGRVPKKSCERWQVDVLLRNAGRKRVPQIVRTKLIVIPPLVASATRLSCAELNPYPAVDPQKSSPTIDW